MDTRSLIKLSVVILFVWAAFNYQLTHDNIWIQTTATEAISTQSLLQHEQTKVANSSTFSARKQNLQGKDLLTSDVLDSAAPGVVRFSWNRSESFVAIKVHIHPQKGQPIRTFPNNPERGKHFIVQKSMRFDLKLSKDPHPDVLAMVCYCSFYDFLSDTLVFPFAVSPTFVEAINSKRLVGGSPHNMFIVLNIDETLEGFSTSGRPDELVISYGGGQDSTALAAMLPKSILVYENQVKTFDVPQKIRPLAGGRVHKWLESRGFDYRVVNTNSRRLGNLYGLLHWSQIFAASIFIMADENKYGVGLGSTIDGTYLTAGGKKYINKPNQHKVAFSMVGVRVISPLHGMSQILTADIIIRDGFGNNVIHCPRETITNGENCYRCDKCRRKELFLRAACELNHRFTSEDTDIPAHTDWSERCSLNFNGDTRKHLISAASQILLRADNSSENVVGIPRDVLQSAVLDVDTSFVYGWYPRAWELETKAMGDEQFVEHWKSVLKYYGIPEMTQTQIDVVEGWKLESW